jgi:Oxidoreductase family, NAD-binding Rossmann fold
MKVIKIGFIDLGTSHPRSFVKRLNAMPDVKVTGVFDRGRVKGTTETEAFAADFGVEIFDSVAKLADVCDGVMVLSADWETHFDDVMTCMERDTPCYCDKPVFGSRDEIAQFMDVAKRTQTLFLGGSGWRWNEVTQDFYTQTCDLEIKDVLIIGQNERFYYGIHAVDWLLGLLGPGIEWVKHEVEGPGMNVFSLKHRRGCTVRTLLETSPQVGRRCWLNVDGKEHFISFDGDVIHDGVCGNFVKMLQPGIQPAPYEAYLESIKVLLAIEEALETGQQIAVADAAKVKSISSRDFMQDYCK